MKQLSQIIQIVKSPFRLAMIETSRHKTVADLFAQFSSHSKIPVYQWVSNEGLQTLEQDPLIIPDTKSPTDVLQFISSSLRFAIYLLHEFPYRRGTRQAVELKKFIASERMAESKIIMVSNSNPLEEALMQHTLYVQCVTEGTPAVVDEHAALPENEIPHFNAGLR